MGMISHHRTVAGAGCLWYADATLLTRLQALGSSVAAWPDIMGAVNPVQATPTAQPTLAACAVTGRPCLSFDGGDSLQSAGNLVFAQPYLLHLVVAPASVAALTRPFGIGLADPNRMLVQFSSPTAMLLYAGANLSVSGIASVIGPNLWTFVVNGASSAIYRNGAAAATASGNAGANGINGPVRVGVGSLLTGSMSAVSVHSGATRLPAVERALCALHGIVYAG